MTPKEFEDLLVVLRPRLSRSLINKYGEEGEDALQAALLRAYERLDQFDHSVSLSTWLYAIAANMYKYDKRKRGKIVIDMDSDVYDVTDDIDSTVANAEFNEWKDTLQNCEVVALMSGEDRASKYRARRKYGS